MAKSKAAIKAKPTAAGSLAAPISRIAKLEKALLEAEDPNPLLELLALARHAEGEVVHKAIWALYRVFVVYIEKGRVGLSLGEEKGEVKQWIKERLVEYVDLLGGLLQGDEPALRSSAVRLLFSLLPPFSAKVSTSTPTAHLTYFRLILPHLTSSLPEDTLEEIIDFWAKYDDLRYLFFREAASSPSPGVLPQIIALDNLPKLPEDINAFYIPSLAAAPSGAPAAKKTKGKDKAALDAPQDWLAYYDSSSDDDDATAGGAGKKRKRIASLSIHASIHSIPAHQTAYSKLWESIFATLPLGPLWVRKILVGLHGSRGILANLKPERRVRFADWLGGLVDAGGAEAMLAMNGLYVLMTEYNLDYPKFYPRLYSLLDAEVLHSPYRARFFRLLHTFLGSPLLPAALVAGFIKRLARRSLTAPPAGALIVIPFVYNLLKRHPGTMVMLQRHAPSPLDANGDGDAARAVDPYDPEEASPAASKAIESSLWEIKALQSHYLASVSTMAKIFSETFTKPEFGLEDFLDHGYATLFDTEIKRRIKHAPALSMSLELDASPAEPFPKHDVDGIWAW